ncbi:MOSC domain-containing protein [Pedobacter frigiditerrae]|uniref:MOSC domain-containing protein n=1 Tax=Pedobacter frigiditerrae TaxID=2530452 RepID=A0A4R0MTI6_9SPHI|nr:MOSC N-terminal beta barrel domain-containing protein [Pedobacter frigiditerrae]TCC90103.1 MOSC domain-containing protein [Pedobacter frigiditerrae]
MDKLHLSQLFIYPIKSLGGIALQQGYISNRGLEHDREWMLIDQEDTFISQRKYHQLALLQTSITATTVTVQHKHKPNQNISFSIAEHLDSPIAVNIWDDHCTGLEVSTKVSKWFSAYLQMDAKLVKMPQTENRKVDPRYAHHAETVGFADAYPSLIIGQSSLDLLNTKLAHQIGMDRFRPNLVFTGGEAHLEDDITEFSIGEVQFYSAKPCSRCIMITVDQQTGEKSQEPLKTLSTYRNFGQKILFGHNIMHTNLGLLRIGDELKITKTR